jgi:DNA repair protein RadA/Sms
LVRSTKNRYGPTDEVGVFAMTEAGFAAVLDPSAEFMSERVAARGVGSCMAAMLEGSRPMLLEVQALCTPVVGDQVTRRPRRPRPTSLQNYFHS